jgi:hypothetical protein
LSIWFKIVVTRCRTVLVGVRSWLVLGKPLAHVRNRQSQLSDVGNMEGTQDTISRQHNLLGHDWTWRSSQEGVIQVSSNCLPRIAGPLRNKNLQGNLFTFRKHRSNTTKTTERALIAPAQQLHGCRYNEFDKDSYTGECLESTDEILKNMKVLTARTSLDVIEPVCQTLVTVSRAGMHVRIKVPAAARASSSVGSNHTSVPIKAC